MPKHEWKTAIKVGNGSQWTRSTRRWLDLKPGDMVLIESTADIFQVCKNCGVTLDRHTDIDGECSHDAFAVC